MLTCDVSANTAYASMHEPNPSQAHAVVFDIDGTLTPSVWTVFRVRKDAVNAVQAYSDKGYEIIYLSTRVSWLAWDVPRSLERNKFPKGTVYLAKTSNDRKQPATFKTNALNSLLAEGWKIDYAYGDSSTDLTAYAASGIPKEHVFAVLRKGELLCQAGIAEKCIDGWSEHLEYIAMHVPMLK